MPPKARKAATKKPSPRAKKADVRADDPDVVAKEAAAPEVGQQIASVAAVDEDEKSGADEEAAATVTDGKTEKEEISEEKIVDAATVERAEEEMGVAVTTVAGTVIGSVEDPMEAADNGSIPEGSGEGKGTSGGEKESEDAVEANGLEVTGEHKEAVDKEDDGQDEQGEDEDPAEEEPEEEDEEEDEEEESEDEGESGDEGNKQIVEEGKGEGEAESISGDDEDNEDDDPASYMQETLTERKKQKEFEIFIGGLDKGAVEEDLTGVFGVFGEIQSVRIVKHPITQKSKGFAFIRYASFDDAKKALAELKDGTEVKGKKIRVSASQDNDTLYLGNICKTWNKDQVLETLKGYGIEQIEDMVLPDDPKSEGKIRGFAFLEFKSHPDAMAAFQRLRKPDAVFGRDVSAKVSFAQAPLHPCEEDLLKVKTVYMEGIPKSWDEEKIKDLCKQYGEIEKIQLSRNFTSSKRKDFGFVEFSSRDSAVACVEGINNAPLGADVNVKANLAKPLYRSRLAKQRRGGYKVQKDEKAIKEAGKSKKKKAKSKAVNDQKGTQSDANTLNKSTQSKSQNNSLKDKKVSQAIQAGKGKKRGRKTTGTLAAANQKPSKKARKNNYGKGHGRSYTVSNNPRISYSSNQHRSHQSAYAPSASGYAARTYPGVSMSQHRRTDLEPHAGYLPPAKPVQNAYEYDARRADAYHLRSNSGYVGGSTAPVAYPGYSNYAGYQAGYAYPSTGTYAYQRPYY